MASGSPPLHPRCHLGDRQDLGPVVSGSGGGRAGQLLSLCFVLFPGSKEQSLGCPVCVTSPLLTATVSV